MIPCIFSPPEAFPSASFVLFVFCLMLEMLLILILVLPQKMGRNWPLIPNMPHLFFSDIIPFLLLGPIAGIGLFPLYMWS
jgi:hypothetical protein